MLQRQSPPLPLHNLKFAIPFVGQVEILHHEKQKENIDKLANQRGGR
jgi:hypothetical protein